MNRAGKAKSYLIEAQNSDGGWGYHTSKNNLMAVDSTATRLMGLRPERIAYLQMMAEAGEPILVKSIEQVGETLDSCRQSFNVLPHFADLKA